MKENKYDFFISHASEDKPEFVRPLAEELTNRGYNIWYDEFSLGLGDSLVEGISKGIKNSLYGIIILSKNFFKKSWTKKELEALLNKEIILNETLILPVWLDVTPKEVYNFSPLLVDKLAVSVKPSELSKVINSIEKKTGISVKSKEQLIQKINSLKRLSENKQTKYFLDLENRIKSIFLFQEEYHNWYTSDDLFENEEEWDDLLVDLKGKKLQSEYGIPNGVWIVPEPFPENEIQRAVKLCKKWIFGELTIKEATELHFLLEEQLDTDLFYILYAIPHSFIKERKAYDILIYGIIEIGVKEKKSLPPSEKKNC
ncbi:toll/interleukin-1 receptor domain-containing protein [Seonamhaeicola algicola]|uniref:ADP-ribosyl cyclase/cyclic ADP-ribose hydrolase n=1 Tax=Seonamhaeicola algicola TaxID=1719036 RepID=A0A5C7B024_9FLAO|nr:toll/interleukin-1 receptor domain-containing protein [Seonamhaeicola algicola]TXE13824.1 toll/interleukin-1 receptor domain-containing protein [Seonamhaeicola algicola]